MWFIPWLLVFSVATLQIHSFTFVLHPAQVDVKEGVTVPWYRNGAGGQSLTNVSMVQAAWEHAKILAGWVQAGRNWFEVMALIDPIFFWHRNAPWHVWSWLQLLELSQPFFRSSCINSNSRFLILHNMVKLLCNIYIYISLETCACYVALAGNWARTVSLGPLWPTAASISCWQFFSK